MPLLAVAVAIHPGANDHAGDPAQTIFHVGIPEAVARLDIHHQRLRVPLVARSYLPSKDTSHGSCRWPSLRTAGGLARGVMIRQPRCGKQPAARDCTLSKGTTERVWSMVQLADFQLDFNQLLGVETEWSVECGVRGVPSGK
jgi:hypothetical protein